MAISVNEMGEKCNAIKYTRQPIYHIGSLVFLCVVRTVSGYNN